MRSLEFEARRVVIDYTDWKGDRQKIIVVPKILFFGSTSEHPELQWMMTGYDEQLQADRTYAMKGIHNWE